VNQSLEGPREQPTISFALLHQVGGNPWPPGAGPPDGLLMRSAAIQKPPAS